MENYKVGEIIEGTITSIKSFGALMIFEDERKGLLHISEIANTFIKNIYRYLVVGKTYQVKILNIEDDGFLKVSINKITKEEKNEYKLSANKHVPIKEEYVDFEALKNNLSDWLGKEEEKNDQH